MPVTPFHFGPGLAFKGVLGQRFSLAAFVVANVAIDLEPAYYLWVDQDPLHRELHTWLGASLLALVLCLLWSLARRLLSRLPVIRRWHWLAALGAVPVLAVGSGLLLGVWSHIALDSVMHADMMPFAPFRGDNPWWGQVPLEPLHWLCIMTGIAGVPLVFLRR